MAYQGRKYGSDDYVQPTVNAALGGGGQPPKPPKLPRRKVRWGRVLLLFCLFGLVMGLTGLAGYGWYLEKKVVAPSGDSEPIEPDRPVSVLVVGLDRDPNSGEHLRRQGMNTDSLLLVRIDPAKQRAALLSIPRDSRVQLPTGPEKINAAYAIGGLDRLKQTVQELTTFKIDRYLMVDFPAFVGVIDSLGGVEFEVDKRIADPEGTVTVQPGKQLLSGKQALAVVRDRQEQMGDIARVERQQRFLAALTAKVKESNVIDWMKGLRAMSDSLQTDMTINEMGRLAVALQGEGMTFTTHRVPGDFLDLYGVSYWKVNQDALNGVIQEMKK